MLEIGNNVTIPILDFDKAKGSLRNVVAVALECKDGLYELGMKEGVLNKMYCHSQHDALKESFIAINDVKLSNSPPTELAFTKILRKNPTKTPFSGF